MSTINDSITPASTVTIQIGTSLREAEGLIIQATLQQARGNLSASARILGIDRTTLYHKMKAYKLVESKNATTA